MPGRGSYGPAGKWIHNRAHRIMEESPDIDKSVAYATATQQAHKVGKSPKGFRTAEGVREAKKKYELPKKEYQKTANARLTALFDELEKIGERIPGGKAEGKPSSAYPVDQLRMGSTEEKEHTSKCSLAEEIAKDYLEELPHYTALKEMEHRLKEKQAAGGGGAAIGGELLGLPGGIYGGLREGGWRGAVGAGLGGATGLGAGIGARHLVQKYLTSGDFGKRHPIAATVMESLPLAVGSTVGGAVGSQLLHRR